MKTRLLALVALCLLFAVPVHAQSYSRLAVDQASGPPVPVTSGAPLPVTGTVTSSGAITSTVNPTGVALANTTSVCVALSGAAQSQALTAASSNVTIAADSTSTGLYFSLSGVASTSNFFVPAGSAFTFTGVPAVSTVYFIGASGAGHCSIFAH